MKSLILFKVMGVTFVASVFSGCHTMGVGDVADWQGKILRGDVRTPIVAKPSPIPEQYRAKVKYDLARDENPRTANVRTQSGSFYTAMTWVGSYAIPDSLDVSDLGKGAIVDVIYERGDQLDFSTRHVNRIVRLVCSGKDKDCQKREWASGRMTQVIDENPGDDFSKFGNTYWRKVSQADIDLGK